MQSAAQSVGVLDRGFGRLNSLIKTGFAVGGIMAFERKIIDVTAKTQSFNNAINASSRSNEEGALNVQFMNRQVDRLGLDLNAAQKGYKTFTGAMMGSSLQGAKANNVFRQVSEATTITGLDAEQTEGSFLALGQMMSKGTVQAEELRGQLAERIPGAFQIGARAMGMTTRQLGDAMKEGLIDSATFLVKFGDELERTYGGKLEASTNSVRSNLNRMGTEWERLQVTVGNSQEGMISGTTRWAASFVGKMNEIFGTLNKLDSAFKNFGNGKDLGFSFLESTDYYANFLSGGMLGSSKEKTEQLQRALQGNYVSQSSRGTTDNKDAEARLLRLRSNFSKSFANKEIGKTEYERGMALMTQALSEVKANFKGLTESAKPGSPEDKPLGAGSAGSLGSATEVSGARPQNINIRIDTFMGPNAVTINSQTTEDGVKEAANITKKEFLELLNDANTMLNR